MAAPAAPGYADVFRAFPRPRRGRPGDPGLFGPGSMVWRVNGEAVLILGGARALLLQVAHPMVAAGVVDHSDFGARPYDRLWHTLDVVLTITFGDSEQSADAAERVAEIHRRVMGERHGRPYSALDPDLLLWVHATLVDSAILVYERFVRPLTNRERERYYEEMKRLAAAFLVPEAALPANHAEFGTYFRETVQGLTVGEEARRLSVAILWPPAPRGLRSVEKLFSLASIGLLPEPIRRGYRLPWSPARERALRAAATASRAALPLLPRRALLWPHAREAAGRVGLARES